MRGAIFDVDGTLLDSMQVWWDVVVDFFKEHGVELPYEEAKEYKEMTMKESIPTIKNRLNLDLSFEELSNTFMLCDSSSCFCNCSSSAFGCLAIFFIKNRLNLDLSFEELSNTFMHMGLKQYETTVPLKKGADKYLKKLHNSGIKIAIATSGYEELCKTAFTRLGVWNYIDACAFSSEVGVNKSNPDVYLLAAKRIGIPPEECTVFEDITTGIGGAKKGGFSTCAIFDETNADETDALKQLSDHHFYYLIFLYCVFVFIKPEKLSTFPLK